jgi:hypothetical protein
MSKHSANKEPEDHSGAKGAQQVILLISFLSNRSCLDLNACVRSRQPSAAADAVQNCTRYVTPTYRRTFDEIGPWRQKTNAQPSAPMAEAAYEVFQPNDLLYVTTGSINLTMHHLVARQFSFGRFLYDTVCLLNQKDVNILHVRGDSFRFEAVKSRPELEESDLSAFSHQVVLLSSRKVSQDMMPSMTDYKSVEYRASDLKFELSVRDDVSGKSSGCCVPKTSKVEVPVVGAYKGRFFDPKSFDDDCRREGMHIMKPYEAMFWSYKPQLAIQSFSKMCKLPILCVKIKGTPVDLGDGWSQ